MASEKVTESSSLMAWVLAFVGWLLPGFGHLGQGHILRGFLGGATILTLFIVGVLLGGHVFDLGDTSEGLLSTLFGLCDLGAGVLYLIPKLTGFAVSEQPSRATSEYGNVFIMVAGLLNFILALDSFDLKVGRKS